MATSSENLTKIELMPSFKHSNSVGIKIVERLTDSRRFMTTNSSFALLGHSYCFLFARSAHQLLTELL